MIRLKLDDLREHAERCLATESPSAAEAHELAARVLEVIGQLEKPDTTENPYRVARAPDGEHETAAVVALERALEAEGERLRTALAEIAVLRRGR